MAVSVSQNCFDTIRRNFELLCDFSDAHAVVVVIDNRIHREPRTTQHRSAWPVVCIEA
jgi:hypothetical protein